jgi:hypothetical protein|tara:strand:+ start:33319 stop:33528 length:210 start_codon:yes stop_codon:yes gene_type:complete
MKAGDLVFHCQDLDDLPDPSPGLVTETYFVGEQEEAIVYFTDRTFGEYHLAEELVRVNDHHTDKENESR